MVAKGSLGTKMGRQILNQAETLLPCPFRASILDGFLMILEGFWCDFGSFLDGFRMIFGKILVEIFWEDFGNVLGIC